MSKIEGKFENFVDYFKDLADNHADIKFFLYGGVEMGMDRAAGSKDFKYPFMWLEQPTIKTMRNEQGLWFSRYSVAFSIIAKSKNDNYQAQEAQVALCHTIMGQVLKQIIDDTATFKLINMSEGFSLDEVDRGWALNHVGWRVGFSLDLVARTWLTI